MTASHPARTIPFRDLLDALRSTREARLVCEQAGADGLRIYCYTQSCVFDAQWNDATLIARGLVLDVERETVAATPFPKFFNAFERGETIPDLPFETFEKVDGSLIIIFWHAGAWKTTTKGTFGTAQALWAARKLKDCDLSALQAPHHLSGRGHLRGEPHRRALRRGRVGVAGRLGRLRRAPERQGGRDAARSTLRRYPLAHFYLSQTGP